MKKIVFAVLAFVLVFSGVNAFAVESPMTVTAHVSGVCTDISATPVDLNYVSGGETQSGNTTISVTCTVGTTVHVSINAGNCSGSNVEGRLLCNGEETMNVNLLEPGSGANFISRTIDSTTGYGTPDNFDVQVSVPAGQNVAPGDYSGIFTVSTDL